MSKQRVKGVFLFLIFLAICLASLFFVFRLYLAPVVKTPIFFVIMPGDSGKVVARRLAQETGFAFPKVLEFAIFLEGDSEELKSGEYLLSPTDSLQNVIAHFIQGSVYYRRFSMIPGQNFKTICANLHRDPMLNHSLKCGPATMTAEEGRLMPDTYFYAKGASDLVIVNMASKAMQVFLSQAWAERDRRIPISRPYQALIVASIIEKEAYLRAEYPLVASVIYRRLNHHMRLQMDSTVIYGLTVESHGVLTKRDLRRRTPYNTYVIYGLPPTPIAMPSQDAILAALHPVASRALYFVAKGDGSHEFSDTLQAQNQAVFYYQIAPDLERKKHGKTSRKVH